MTPKFRSVAIFAITDLKILQHYVYNSFHMPSLQASIVIMHDISWFLSLPTVCGLRWLTTTFRNPFTVPSSKVNCNYSKILDNRAF